MGRETGEAEGVVMSTEPMQVLREWPADWLDGEWVDAHRICGGRVATVGRFRRRGAPLKDGSGADDLLFAEEFLPRPAGSRTFLIRIRD